MTAGKEIQALALVAAIAAYPNVACGLGDTSVNSEHCSVAAGRDASNVTLICINGLTQEQVTQAIRAAVEGATAPLNEVIANLSKQLGITENALRTLLKAIGEDPNVTQGGMVDAVLRAAADYKALEAKVAALNPENPTARGLVEKARTEIQAGQLKRAHEFLQQATSSQLAAAREAQNIRKQAQASEDAQMLGAAQSTAVDAEVAMTERDYLHAAELFDQAAIFIPAEHPGAHGHALLGEGDAYYRQGEEHGEDKALRRSIDLYNRVLAEVPREQDPALWARTQDNHEAFANRGTVAAASAVKKLAAGFAGKG